MRSSIKKIETIDAYIDGFPAHIQEILNKMRKTIQVVAPDATEKISYGIPTFFLYGNLVHFAAYKDHISFFPASSGVLKFSKELSMYKTSKGTIQFSLDEPIPYDLIQKITMFRIKENTMKYMNKKKAKA